MGVPHVVLLTGLPATGKYTVAAELIGLIEERSEIARLVDNHYVNNVIFPLIRSDGASKLPAEVWEQVEAVRRPVFQTIEELSPPEWHFVFTAYVSGIDDEWFVDRVAELAQRRSSDFTLVELTCDLDELERRIPAPGRAERFKMTDVAGIRDLYERGTPEIDGYHAITIDTTDLPPREAAEQILAVLLG